MAMEVTPIAGPSSSSSGDGGDEPGFLTALEWSDEEAIAFGEAIYAGGRCLLPIGVNKHFNMMSIRHRFQSAIKKTVDSALLWKRLENNYNMAKLDTIAECPFPNDQSDFSLPESDFNQLIRDRKNQAGEKMFDDESRDSGSGRETPPTLPIAKRGPTQSALASSSSKRKYSSSFSETGSESGGPGPSTSRKSTAGTSGSGGPSKAKRRT